MASAIPARTTSWNWAATAGLAPPNSAPTNAPGSVTRPVDFVWSSVGMSDSRTASRPMSACACAGVAPTDSQPSISSARARDARRKLRPASVAALIELPMTMPPTATTYLASRSTSRSAEHHHQRRDSAGQHSEDGGPPAVPELPHPAHGGERCRRQHENHERHHGPRHVEDAAQQQRDDRQLDDGSTERPQREPAEARAGPARESHGRAGHHEQAGPEPGVVDGRVHPGILLAVKVARR